MNNKKAWLKQCLSTFIVITVFAYLIYQIFLMKDELASLNWQNIWPYILLSLLLCIATQAIQALQWHALVQYKSPQPIHFKALLASFFYPIPGKYLPGKVLYAAARVEFIKQSFAINRKQGSALFMLETIGMLISAALLSAPYIIQWLWPYIAAMPSSLHFIGAIITLSITLLLIILMAMPSAREKILSLPILQKIINFLHSTFILPKKMSFKLLINYHLMWISFGASGLLIVLALLDLTHIQFSTLDYFMIMSAFICAWLIGFLSLLTPGGLGVREASLVLFLSPLIGVETAALAAIISRIIWTLAEFSGVLYCALLKTPKPKLRC